jgi:hypothetical protein
VASRGRDGVPTGVEEVEEGEDDAAGDGRVRAGHIPHELLGPPAPAPAQRTVGVRMRR